MVIRICDVCHQNKKTVSSVYRIGYKYHFKMDVCKAHQGFLNGLTLEQGLDKYMALVRGNPETAWAK